MIETALFLLLLATLVTMRTGGRWTTIACFVAAAAAISLLLASRITEPLTLSF